MSANLLHSCRYRCACVALALAVLTAPAAASDLTQRLIGDAGDGRIETVDFVAAALVASGITDECELAGWLDAYRQHSASLSRSNVLAAERLAAIHDSIHDHLLRGRYDAGASDLRRTLTTGDYNCLSSLVLFVDQCQRASIPVEIWLTRGHVFLRAVVNGEPVELQPATRDFTARPAVWRSGARRLTITELLGKFYYNRGVELLKDRQFAEGIELLQISLQLDPRDADARANLVAGLNNWAVDHLQSRRYDDAATLIGQGLSLDPQFVPLIANEQVLRAKRSTPTAD